jgi:hypothetical protein
MLALVLLATVATGPLTFHGRPITIVRGQLHALRNRNLPEGTRARAVYVSPTGQVREVVFPAPRTGVVTIREDESLGLELDRGERVTVALGFQETAARPYLAKSKAHVTGQPLILHPPDLVLGSGEITTRDHEDTEHVLKVRWSGQHRIFRTKEETAREVDQILTSTTTIARQTAAHIRYWAKDLFPGDMLAFIHGYSDASPAQFLRDTGPDRVASIYRLHGAAAVLDGEVRMASGGPVSTAGRARIARAFRQAAEEFARRDWSGQARWEAEMVNAMADDVDAIVEVARRLLVMRQRAERRRGEPPL